MIAHKYYLDTAHKSKLLSEQGARMHVSANKQALTTLNTLLCCADTGSQASTAICIVRPQLALATKTVAYSTLYSETVHDNRSMCQSFATPRALLCFPQSVNFRKFSTGWCFCGSEGTTSHFNEWFVSAFDPSQNSIVVRVTTVVTSTCLLIAVAQWLRFCAPNRKVAGSIPDGVIGFFR
jgi:hypothetical protein